MDHVCCYYSRFVDPLELKSISDNNVVLIAAFKTYILHRYDLDVCGCCSGSFNFCHNCWTCVSRGRQPKFGISNKMPKLCYQYYPTLLEDLTSTEEAVIAKVHPVMTILKLRPNNSLNPGIYKGICGHSVLLLIILWYHMTSHVIDLTRSGQFQIITDPAPRSWLCHQLPDYLTFQIILPTFEKSFSINFFNQPTQSAFALNWWCHEACGTSLPPNVRT